MRPRTRAHQLIMTLGICVLTGCSSAEQATSLLEPRAGIYSTVLDRPNRWSAGATTLIFFSDNGKNGFQSSPSSEGYDPYYIKMC
jgi:hypothetical protein